MECKICDFCRKLPQPLEGKIISIQYDREDLLGWSIGKKRKLDICDGCFNKMMEFIKTN